MPKSLGSTSNNKDLMTREAVTDLISSHNHSASDINSGTLPVARGGTGKTSLKDAANALINSLSEGTSIPSSADYYVSQYVSGGTSTTTYHRRPISKIWDYCKSVGAVSGANAEGTATNLKLRLISQADYDALSTKDSTTIYIIV